MGTFIDMKGKTFGRLTVLECVGKNKVGVYLWRCRCSCEEHREKVLNGSMLRSGHVKSCGCLHSPGMNEYKSKLKQRLEKYSRKVGDCIEWKTTNRTTAFGYGFLNFRRKQIMAHRASWIVNNGDIPKGMWVLHRCDNPSCINIEHLFLGTCRDNVQDMYRKNRSNDHLKGLKGMQNNSSKLSDEEVTAIRNFSFTDIYTKKDLCINFGISIAQLNNILSERAWPHLVDEDLKKLQKDRPRELQFMIGAFFDENEADLISILKNKNDFWKPIVLEAVKIILLEKYEKNI